MNTMYRGQDEITVEHGFGAFITYLGGFQERDNTPHTSWDGFYESIAIMLCAMLVIGSDHRPMDMAYWQDWCLISGEIVKYEGDPFEDTGFSQYRITLVEAFKTMVHFLKYYKDEFEFESIDLILDEMRLDRDELPENNSAWHAWLQAVQEEQDAKVYCTHD